MSLVEQSKFMLQVNEGRKEHLTATRTATAVDVAWRICIRSNLHSPAVLTQTAPASANLFSHNHASCTSYRKVSHHLSTMDALGRQIGPPIGFLGPGLKISSTHSSSVALSPLFMLPRELRDYIYNYTFYSPQRLRVTKDGGVPEPALLLTCNIIREDAVKLFYCRKRLILSIDSYDHTVLAIWTRKRIYLARDYDLAPSAPYYSHTGPGNWNNLKLFVRMHHAGHIGRLYCEDRGSRHYTHERYFIMGLFNAAKEMGHRPWSAVEPVLDTLRIGLIVMHCDWAL